MAHLLDIILITVFAFVFVIILFTGTKILGEFNTTLYERGSSEIQQSIIEQGANTASVFNYLFLFLLFGSGIAVAISAFFINSHPIFFFISLPVFIMVLIIAGVISNAYETFSESSVISSTAASFPLINDVMNSLPLYIFIIGIVVLFLLYAKGGATTP